MRLNIRFSVYMIIATLFVVSSSNHSVIAQESWYYFKSEDELSGEVSHYAISPNGSPTKILDFPYSNLESWIGVGCENNSKWAYFGFSSSPNIANDETEDGYSLSISRIKIDDELTRVQLYQKWGSSFMQIWNSNYLNETAFIQKLDNANKILLEIDWYGEGKIIFEYSLKGSSSALQKLNAMCS